MSNASPLPAISSGDHTSSVVTRLPIKPTTLVHDLPLNTGVDGFPLAGGSRRGSLTSSGAPRQGVDATLPTSLQVPVRRAASKSRPSSADPGMTAGGGGYNPLPAISEHKLTEAQQMTTAQSGKTQDYSDLVCQTCQHSLLHVFDHCLANKDNTIPSPHHVDEVADAKRRHPPPFFHLIKDPVKHKHEHYVDLGEKLLREQRARTEAKREEDQMIAVTRSHAMKTKVLLDEKHEEWQETEKAEGGLSANRFSGILYKQTLQSKNHKIEQLKERLMEKTDSEARELENVKRLQVALGKSMQYYIKAEQWQLEEASILQQDIRSLKKEMSVIMACLIHAEAEKKELRNRLRDSDNTLNAKDMRIKELEKFIIDLRSKLHDSLKDYLRLNDQVANLSREAANGNEAAQNRNALLQKNLDQLSKEGVENNDEYLKVKKKVNDLETELEEIVKQFNTTNEAKKMLTQENMQLMADLKQLKADLATHMANEKAGLEQRAVLEARVTELQLATTALQQSNDARVKSMQNTINGLEQSKKEAEALIVKLTSENARYKAQLKDMTTKKETLDDQLRELQGSAKTIEAEHERAMRNLRHELADARKECSMMAEKREQSIFQVAELEAALGREMGMVKVQSSEIERWKQEYTELKVTMKDEMDRLNAQKANLSDEKSTLTKTVSELKQEVKTRKDEFVRLKMDSESTEKTLSEKLSQIQVEFSTLQSQFESLTSQHSSQTEALDDMSLKYDRLYQDHQQLAQKFVDTASQLARLQKDHTSLQHFKDTLLADKDKALQQKEELQRIVDRCNSKYNELQILKQQIEADSIAKAQAREATIERLTAANKDQYDELYRLKLSYQELKEAHRDITNSLKTSTKYVSMLEHSKSQLEQSLDTVRAELMTERKMRLEFERMQQRLDRSLAEQQLEQIRSMERRDQKMTDVDVTLQKEFERLQHVVKTIVAPLTEQISSGSTTPLPSGE